MWAYFFAYVLSIFRLPFALIPYLIKLSLFLYLKGSFSNFWNKYFVQFIRGFGDFVNFLIILVLFSRLYATLDLWIIKIILFLVITTEAIRLATEKGVMIFSGLWQLIPHRSIANSLHSKLRSRFLMTYTSYYILSDQERLDKVFCELKAFARLSKNPQTILKLEYVNCFKVVSDWVDLRAGEVRNVARGEIYIHARWTNDPQLLYGLALRRSPWIFDPRYLRRPFYYRTEANYLMTLFVFQNASLCPLFAAYQFGHEIKSARFDAFFRIARYLGFDFEETVRADGTYNFDVFAKSIVKRHLNATAEASRPLWNDDEVIADLAEAPLPSAPEIAQKYTYPLIYVQDVLMQKIINHRNITNISQETFNTFHN